MAKAQINFGELGGVGDKPYRVKVGTLSGGSTLSVNITGKATHVYCHFGNGYTLQNTDPTTGEIFDSKSWQNADGTDTFTEETMYFIRTNGNIAMNTRWSVANQNYALFYTVE